jgi:hypothetical protein
VRKKYKARRIVKAARSGVRSKLDLDEWFDLTIGGPRDAFAGDEERRANYFQHRDQLVNRGPLTTRPFCFWDYEPDIPAELRNDAMGELRAQWDPALEPEGGVSSWHSREAAASCWAHSEMNRRRARWLQSAGQHHLRPGEREAFEKQRETRKGIAHARGEPQDNALKECC